MIGHFLLNLNAEQEDRVLTEHMKPGYLRNGCLIGVAISRNDADFWYHSDGRSVFYPGGTFSLWRGVCNVAQRYDDMCYRFTADRVNAAIRNRIWANRARRELTKTGVCRSPPPKP